MNLRQNFGKRLKELRTKKNITQAELAEKSGIDSKHVSHIETGHSFPKADLIEKFANELNISVSDMFDFKCIKSKNDLLEEINLMLEDASEENVRQIYKLINAFFK